MRNLFLGLLFFCFTAHAQVINKNTDANTVDNRDTLIIDSGEKDSMTIYKPTINDYQYQFQFSPKKIIDTTFTINKSYQYAQYNNTDNFAKIPFANIGSGFQQLYFLHTDEDQLQVLPLNKSYGILSSEAIRYYDVKTPTTTIVYHNAMQNGGVLQTTYTQNVGKNFNFALEYMGLRSQGFYKRSLAAHNNFIISAQYHSKNGRYDAFAHFIHQNMNNEENGGIADLDLFLQDGDAFDNRENLAVNLNQTDSRFSSRRYYFTHQFSLFNPEKFPFKIRHTLYQQTNKYYYIQKNLEDYLYENETDILSNTILNSKKYSKNLSNTVSLVWDNAKFKLDVGVRYQHIIFGINSLPYIVNNFDFQTYSESRLGAVGHLEITLWDKFHLKSYGEFSKGKSFGNLINSQNTITFEPFSGYQAEAFLRFQSAAPSFNFLMNYSPYIKYNYHLEDYQNQNIVEIGGKIGVPFYKTHIFGKLSRINHYTYFDTNALPAQSQSALTVSQIGGEATFNYRKFYVQPTLLFQSTLGNKSLFPIPNFVGRASLYWQSKAFKKAAEIQAGIKLYYFTKFASREYFPMVNDFILPDDNAYTIGGKPIADIFFNMKVKRMFFFIEGQHINSTFMQNKSYTAPYYPISDFRLNIGIVWYLFH